ncbi:hypothetical protein [Verminephrobacter aporrectodeae]|uniref:hypothetical protein n=1 Tax=Verminephrobacter aporrectodeae TaxID=1110389 RepID=UPI00224376E3|nr:hypothetical protein [Verminephrobacter aporrectodeae]
MPIVDVEDVLPLPLKIGTEGIVFVHPLLGVDPTRTKIYELKLLVNGDPHDVTNFEESFELGNWTFSFFVPQSFHSLPGPSVSAAISFKLLSQHGEVFHTSDDFLVDVEIVDDKSPFSVDSITPTSVELDDQSTAQLSVTGDNLSRVSSKCTLVGPSPVNATVTGEGNTTCSVVIKGSDVSVFGKYRVMLYEVVTRDNFLIQTFINIEEKIPTLKLELLSVAPDDLSPGDSFKLEVSKDVATASWDDVRIGDIQIDAAGGGTAEVSHGTVNGDSETEGSINCSVPSSFEVTAKEEATLTLSATYKGKPMNVTNTLQMTLVPGSQTKTFSISSCTPTTVSKADAQAAGFRFSLMGQNLDQITSIKFGNSYQMNILSRTASRIQCRFLTSASDIPENVYRFTVRYKDPQSGVEESKIVQNVRVKITP